MEVMGCDVGWICLYLVIVVGVEVVFIFEIFYDIEVIKVKFKLCFDNGYGFVNIVILEGVKFVVGSVVSK